MGLSDMENLARYRQGDIAGLTELVERYQRPLFSFVLHMTRTPAEAEDVFQEVWMRVIRRADSFKEGSFQAWLLRIARNVMIDRFRRRKPEVSLENPDGDAEGDPMDRLPSHGVAPDGEAAAADLGRRIAAAVAELPAEQKEVFVMRVELDMPFKAIAEIQGTSINTALSRMQYAVSRLRGLLAEEGREWGVES